MFWTTVSLTAIAALALRASASVPADAELTQSIEQLRHAIGLWSAQTDFLGPDGTVAKSVSGSYEYSWVMPDQVVSGRSDIPELKQSAALLLYLKPATRQIEMVSVGADGRLWVMNGPFGSETRVSHPFATAGGGESQLRFTRSNVQPNSFESHMEYTEDGGQSWQPGNHQRFQRLR